MHTRWLRAHCILLVAGVSGPALSMAGLLLWVSSPRSFAPAMAPGLPEACPQPLISGRYTTHGQKG